MGDYAEKAATEEERGSLLCNLLARMRRKEAVYLKRKKIAE
jgi:hypothetical protein